jgi:hypothetical protein
MIGAGKGNPNVAEWLSQPPKETDISSATLAADSKKPSHHSHFLATRNP